MRVLQIAGAFIGSALVSAAFADPLATYTQFDYPGASTTFGSKINIHGDIVGVADTVGFIYHTTSGSFETLSIGDLTLARGINDDGTVVGDYRDSLPPYDHGFIYTGVFTTLDYSSDRYTRGRAINNAGDISGNTLGGGTPSVGFVYSGGAFTTFSYGYNTYAPGLNNLGVVVGGATDANGDNSRGYIYSGGIFSDVFVPGATNTFAYGINDRGDVVGSWWGADLALHGFLLRDGVYTTIDIPGAINTEIIGIGNDGTIVGDFMTDEFSDHGFYASVTSIPEPEPSALLIIGLACVSLVLRLRVVPRRPLVV